MLTARGKEEETMAIHLQRDLERLKKELLDLGARVEEQVTRAISALTDRRTDLAEQVLQGDRAIDMKEILVEEECLKVLALHQPVANDLRFIVTVMKVNNDLERMGDLAVNVAERASYIATHDPLPVAMDFPGMGRKVQEMLRESLDALVRTDTALARKVCASDDVVDEYNRRMFDLLQPLMQSRPDAVRRAIHVLSASRHLERIADLATNIAEDVIFMVDGEVVRHRTEQYGDEARPDAPSEPSARPGATPSRPR
jgi:phosphate transport system protein